MLLRSIALSFLFITTGHCAVADDMKMPMNAKDVKWGPAPSVLPKGAQIAVVSGDPSKDGAYVLRLKMPKGTKSPRTTIRQLNMSR